MDRKTLVIACLMLIISKGLAVVDFEKPNKNAEETNLEKEVTHITQDIGEEEVVDQLTSVELFFILQSGKKIMERGKQKTERFSCGCCELTSLS